MFKLQITLAILLSLNLKVVEQCFTFVQFQIVVLLAKKIIGLGETCRLNLLFPKLEALIRHR